MSTRRNHNSDSDSDNEDKKIEKKYQKLTQLEHVLKKPNMYIGSIDSTTDTMWVYDDEQDKLVSRDIEYVPGLFKIFDEILVNASDQTKQHKSCNKIKVDIDQEEGIISVYNNGPGIPIIKHSEHKIMIPQMIFGEFLTSSNYDESVKRTWGGTNGLGAKLANVYSKQFIIETVDSNKKKKYVQVFSNNMSKKNEPKITDSNSESYVKITFTPDYEKFDLEGITDDIYALFKKRVYDISACTAKHVQVYFNGKQIKVKGIKDYVDYFYDDDAKLKKYFDNSNDRWRVAVLYDPNYGAFNHVSYVNSISTSKGGTHVDSVINQLCDKIKKVICTKHKDLKVKASQIRDNLTIFVDCDIENPTFSSQTKTDMTLPVAKYGTKSNAKYVIDDKFVASICKSGIVDEVVKMASLKQMGELKKTDGKKNQDVSDIPKLEDADDAGTKRSEDTCLILTEGDSAKQFAMHTLSVIGRKKFGVFPLKGKMLNVRDANIKQLSENKEIINIKRILGLQQNVVYNDLKKLRYGGLLILADQDLDGFHIKGLIINFIHYFWPSLIEKHHFVKSLSTPLIKAIKGTGKKAQVKIFYSEIEFEKWIKEEGKNGNPPLGWKPKYYKGLATHDQQEARACVSVDISKQQITYVYEKEKKDDSDSDSDSESESDDEDSDNKKRKPKKKTDESDDEDTETFKSSKKKVKNPNDAAMELGFAKSKAVERKPWICNFDKNTYLDNKQKKVTLPQFIHKELIQFSSADVRRSVPSVKDGWKPSQRKAWYGACKIKKKGEMKVSAFASEITVLAGYHHGEQSMISTVVNMAQDYLGANNINVFHPQGMFGTRLVNGDDAGAPRYIQTYIEPIMKFIVKEVDNPILTKQIDEGKVIEPEAFMPIIPMVLVNGTQGIGTGFSTTIHMYNPEDIIANLLRKINGEDMKHMTPWYRGFLGTVKKINVFTYEAIGKYEVLEDDTLHIMDLPIDMATEKYNEFLSKTKNAYEEYDEKKSKSTKIIKLIGYRSRCTATNAEYYLYFEKGTLKKYMEEEDEFIKKMKLKKVLHTTNMHLFDKNGKIKKYSSTIDIINDYYEVRLDAYEKRRVYLIKKLKLENERLKWTIKFIQDVIDETIIVAKNTKAKIIARVEELEYPMLVTEVKQDTDDDEPKEAKKSYNYITSLSLFALTKDNIDELKRLLKDNQDELDYLTNAKPEDLWKTELKELLKEYKTWFADWTEKNNENRKTKKEKIDNDDFKNKLKNTVKSKQRVTSRSKKTTKSTTNKTTKKAKNGRIATKKRRSKSV